MTKPDHSSKPGIMLSYSTQSKGCKIWEKESQSFVISRDDEVKESSFFSPKATLEDSDETSDTFNV